LHRKINQLVYLNDDRDRPSPVIDIIISSSPNSKKIPNFPTRALIDTGAFNSVMNKKLIDSWHLDPSDYAGEIALLSNQPLQDEMVSYIFRDPVYKYDMMVNIDGISFDSSVIGLYFNYGNDVNFIIGWDILKKLCFCCLAQEGIFCYDCRKCKDPKHLHAFKKGD
jgi:hypothetical protein